MVSVSSQGLRDEQVEFYGPHILLTVEHRLLFNLICKTCVGWN